MVSEEQQLYMEYYLLKTDVKRVKDLIYKLAQQDEKTYNQIIQKQNKDLAEWYDVGILKGKVFAYTKIYEELLSTIGSLPFGQIERKGFDYEWDLEEDKKSSQPIGLHISTFKSKFDYSNKDGFKATLGEFGGGLCYIAPLRENIEQTVNDCFIFMRSNNDLGKIKEILNKGYFKLKNDTNNLEVS